MTLMDCGCGPGSITADLAKVVAPGKVIGIDIGETQVQRAERYAAERGIANVEFRVASIYQMPFADSSFDVAYAHMVLEHLADPVKALKEIHRVLKPGGIVAVRDCDWGSMLSAPRMEIIEQAYNLYMKFWKSNGGDPFLGRRHKELLRQAGFKGITTIAPIDICADSVAVNGWAQVLSQTILLPAFIERATEHGWADTDTIEMMSDAFLEWGEHPDAFRAIINPEAVAWKE